MGFVASWSCPSQQGHENGREIEKVDRRLEKRTRSPSSNDWWAWQGGIAAGYSMLKVLWVQQLVALWVVSLELQQALQLAHRSRCLQRLAQLVCSSIAEAGDCLEGVAGPNNGRLESKNRHQRFQCSYCCID